MPGVLIMVVVASLVIMIVGRPIAVVVVMVACVMTMIMIGRATIDVRVFWLRRRGMIVRMPVGVGMSMRVCVGMSVLVSLAVPVRTRAHSPDREPHPGEHQHPADDLPLLGDDGMAERQPRGGQSDAQNERDGDVPQCGQKADLRRAPGSPGRFAQSPPGPRPRWESPAEGTAIWAGQRQRVAQLFAGGLCCPSIDGVQIWADSASMLDEAVSDPQLLLRQHGVQVTAQRLAVLRAVACRPHTTADEIGALVRADIGAVSRQAIYDALGILTDRGLIRRIQPARSPARYEARVDDNHHHLVCRHCGATVDVDCAVGSAPCLQAVDNHGFVIDQAEVIYWGRCPSCQRVAGGEPGGGPIST